MRMALWDFLHENPSLQPSRMLYECQCVVLADDRGRLRCTCVSRSSCLPNSPPYMWDHYWGSGDPMDSQLRESSGIRLLMKFPSGEKRERVFAGALHSVSVIALLRSLCSGWLWIGDFFWCWGCKALIEKKKADFTALAPFFQRPHQVGCVVGWIDNIEQDSNKKC